MFRESQGCSSLTSDSLTPPLYKSLRRQKVIRKSLATKRLFQMPHDIAPTPMSETTAGQRHDSHSPPGTGSLVEQIIMSRTGISGPLTYDRSILATDFVPDTAQARDLRTKMEVQKHEIGALNSEITALKRRTHMLCARVDDLEETLRLHEALLSPCRWLAPETLGEVFGYCLASTDAVTADPTRAPLLVIQVCRRWRRVACGTPRLWARLFLGRGFFLDPYTIIPLWLRNSGTLPLEIRISVQDWRDISKPQIADSAIIHLFAPSMHRCRSFAGSVSTVALEEIFGHDIVLPYLESLELWLPDHDQMTSASAVPAMIGILHIPHLQSIILNDTGFMTRALHGPLTSVRHLQLTGQETFGLLSHSSCLDFIAMCPNVQSCILTLSKDPGRTDLPLHSPVVLESLRHLHLIFQFSPHDPIPFLKALHAPYIERLTLQNHGGVSPVPHVRRVLNLLLSARPHTIKELHLSSLFVPTSDWVPSLCELTELRSLSIVGDSLDEGFFAALTSEGSSLPWSCPQLSNLKLHHVTGLLGLSGDHLVAFIRGRAPPVPDGGRGKMKDGREYLQSVSLVLCDMEIRHENELRDIEKQCSGALHLHISGRSE